jgi:hypothetical protein
VRQPKVIVLGRVMTPTGSLPARPSRGAPVSGQPCAISAEGRRFASRGLTGHKYERYVYKHKIIELSPGSWSQG